MLLLLLLLLPVFIYVIFYCVFTYFNFKMIYKIFLFSYPNYAPLYN